MTHQEGVLKHYLIFPALRCRRYKEKFFQHFIRNFGKNSNKNAINGGSKGVLLSQKHFKNPKTLIHGKVSILVIFS